MSGGGARKGDSAGDAGENIDEQVGIHEQVGSMKESGEAVFFSIWQNQSCVNMLLPQ